MAGSSLSSDNILIKDEANKYRILLQNSRELSDEILEIKQIEYEQHLIIEEINRIDAEKQRLQNLLKFLQTTKLNDKKFHTKQQRTQLQTIDSGSESD